MERNGHDAGNGRCMRTVVAVTVLGGLLAAPAVAVGHGAMSDPVSRALSCYTDYDDPAGAGGNLSACLQCLALAGKDSIGSENSRIELNLSDFLFIPI